MRPARSLASSSCAASTSLVSTNARNAGTNSLRTSATFALRLHCGHFPPLPFLCRVSHLLMHACPKQCPQERALTWCAPSSAQGSKQMLHESAPFAASSCDAGGSAGSRTSSASSASSAPSPSPSSSSSS